MATPVLICCCLHSVGAAVQQGAAIVSTAMKPASAATPSDTTPTCDCTNSTSSGSSSSTAWLSGLHREFQRSIHPHIKSAWALAVGSDLRYKGTTINEAFTTSAVERVAMAYVQELFKLAATDPVVSDLDFYCEVKLN